MLTSQSATRKDKRTGIADMQHRHFTTIATILSRLVITTDLSANDRKEIAAHFAMELRATNPKFDRARFLRACGLEG